MASAARAAEIRAMVRNAVIGAIQTDLDGDERLFKEVWEECDDIEKGIAENEARRCIAAIRGMIARP